MIVRPVEGFIEKQINGKMNEYLSNQKNSLNQDQIDKIVNDYNVLKEYLEKEQDSMDSLPSIKKSDINIVGQYDSITKTEDDVSILAIPLNKITYIHISFQIDFTHPLFNYLPLLTLIIGKVGAGDKNEEQMETFMKLNCNEVNFYITEKTDLNDIHKGCCTISSKTYCLDRNIDTTIDIMKTILFQPHLKNKEIIKSIILSRLNQLNKNHQNNGNELLSYMLQSGLTDSCALRNVINGPYLAHFMKELAEKDDWNDVCEKLEICYKEIFLKSKAKAFIHSSSVDSPAVSQVKEIVDVFNKNRNMNYDVCSPVSRHLFENHKNIFLQTESRINFTAMACTTVPYNDDRSPLFDVLSYVIKNEFLYDTVRNKIGAYGVTVVHNNQTGTFVISSYRDPNPTECLQAFKQAIEICSSSEKIDDEMIDRAIMRIFVKLDRPVSPSTKGFLEFNGKSKEIESKRRNIILKATKQQVVDIAKLLKEKDWRYGIFSNKENFNPPEGLKIIKLNELYC